MPFARKLRSSLWIVVLVLALALALYFAPCWLIENDREAHKLDCAANLRAIYNELLHYADGHGGNLPENLVELQTDHPSMFICPASVDAAAGGAPVDVRRAKLNPAEHISYLFVGSRLVLGKVSPTTVLAYEPLSNHEHERCGPKGINVLYGDGRVEWLTKDRAEQFVRTHEGARRWTTTATTKNAG
jgi:prepilin-type processing-associated H-X9-DG protein